MPISDAQFEQWLSRDNADRVCLMQHDYMTEEAGEPVKATFYASDKGYIDDVNGIEYPDCLRSMPKFTRSLSGDRLGVYQSSVDSVEIDNANGEYDGVLNYPLDGSESRYYYGDRSWPFSDFRQLFSAIGVKASAPSTDRISIQQKDAGFLLDKSIGGQTLVGGTGPQADQARPLNFGYLHQVECKVIDKTVGGGLYCHSDSGDATTAVVVRVRGVDITATTAENGDGTITLGTGADGNITADVLALLPGSDPGDYTTRRVSDAFRQLIGTRGGLIDAGRYIGPGPTFTAGDVDDYYVGISLSQATNLQSALLPQMVDSGNCSWSITRGGQFTFGRLRPDDIESFALTPVEITQDDIDNGSFKLDHALPQYYRFQAYMNKNWSIQTNLATSLDADEFAQFQRKGLYLEQDDAVGDTYADKPELYDLSMVESPPIETLLSAGYDEDDVSVLQQWMETRRFMFLPWIETVQITVGIAFYALELCDVVRLTIKEADGTVRFGLDGVLFQVIGIVIRPTDAKVDLTLIRRRRATPYPDDWVRTTTDEDALPISFTVPDSTTPPVVVKPPGGPGDGGGDGGGSGVPGDGPWYPGNIGVYVPGSAGAYMWNDRRNFFVQWTVLAGPMTNGVTAEANIRAAHGGGSGGDGSAIGSAWVILPLATELWIFQVTSVGDILYSPLPYPARNICRRLVSMLITDGSGSAPLVPLSYAFDGSNALTSSGLPSGVAENATGQISYTFKIQVVNNVIVSYKVDGVELSITNPFSGHCYPDPPSPYTLPSDLVSIPTYQVFNATPSDVQTWPVAVTGFSTNWTP